MPESDKTLRIEAFIPLEEIDTAYFDKPYYLAPDKIGTEAFVLLRDGMKKANVAAIARTVLFRRMRTVLIRAHETGLIGSTLNFDYEVRSAQKAFEEIPDIKIEGEMLELAEHIINTKAGTYETSKFDDRYEVAIAELVKAKIEGRTLPKKKVPVASKPSDLLQTLRESAGMTASKTKRKAANPDRTPFRRTASKTASKSRASTAHTRRAS